MNSMASVQCSKILEDLKRRSTVERAKQMKRYLKTSKLEFYGVKLPEVHKVTRKHVKDIDTTDLKALMSELWAIQVFEMRRAAINILERYAKKGGLETALQMASNWIDDIDTWALLDPLATPCLGILLLRDWAVEETLKTWRDSDNFWRRRASVLPYHHLVRSKIYREEYTSKVLDAVIPHIADKEFFVGKAAGWVLRELSKRNPAPVREFIRKHEKDMTPLVKREGSKKLD